MKLLEIHKNGINAHNNEVSFYGIDFQTKTLIHQRIRENKAKCVKGKFKMLQRNAGRNK